MIVSGSADWGPYAQTVLGILLIILSLVLVVEGIQTILGKNKAHSHQSM